MSLMSMPSKRSSMASFLFPMAILPVRSVCGCQNLCLTPQQSKSTMPKQNGEEPAQRSKSPIKLCLLGALKEGTY